MAKQALVIGLGRFGMAVAQTLSDRRAEVLAVDANAERVRQAAAFAAEAICFDATDAEALARISPERRDVCICAIGDEATESAIICTALLRQLGAKRVVARASNAVQTRILKLVGAHEVVNPIREFGERFAHKIVYERLISEMPIGGDLLIAEVRPPPSFVGRTLAELQLPQRFNITVVAVRQEGSGAVALPNPNERLKPDDIIIVVSREDAVARLMEQT